MDSYRMIDAKDAGNLLSAMLILVSNAILFMIASLRRYFLPAILVFVILVFAGYLYKNATGYKYFESEMACQYNSMNNKFYGELIQKLDMLANTGSVNTLSKTLNISEAQAQQILSISAVNIFGSPLYEDNTAPDKKPIYIRLKATDRNVFAPMEQAIIKYLNGNSPYREKQKQLEFTFTEEKIKYLNRNLALSDSIINDFGIYLKNGRTVSADTSGKIFNINSMFRLKEQMEDKLLQYEWREKELDQRIEILYRFSPPDHPQSSNGNLMRMILLLAIGLSLLTAVFLNLLRSSNVPAGTVTNA
jgi:hypothetical protein